MKNINYFNQFIIAIMTRIQSLRYPTNRNKMK